MQFLEESAVREFERVLQSAQVPHDVFDRRVQGIEGNRQGIPVGTAGGLLRLRGLRLLGKELARRKRRMLVEGRPVLLAFVRDEGIRDFCDFFYEFYLVARVVFVKTLRADRPEVVRAGFLHADEDQLERLVFLFSLRARQRALYFRCAWVHVDVDGVVIIAAARVGSGRKRCKRRSERHAS